MFIVDILYVSKYPVHGNWNLLSPDKGEMSGFFGSPCMSTGAWRRGQLVAG